MKKHTHKQSAIDRDSGFDMNTSTSMTGTVKAGPNLWGSMLTLASWSDGSSDREAKKSHCCDCFPLFQLWIPTRQRRFDPFWKCRVGEAAHPGPAGSRRTKRMREQKNSSCGTLDLGGLDLLPLLRPAIEKMLRELVSKFLSGDGLARLMQDSARVNSLTKSSKSRRKGQSAWPKRKADSHLRLNSVSHDQPPSSVDLLTR